MIGNLTESVVEEAALEWFVLGQRRTEDGRRARFANTRK